MNHPDEARLLHRVQGSKHTSSTCRCCMLFKGQTRTTSMLLADRVLRPLSRLCQRRPLAGHSGMC